MASHRDHDDHIVDEPSGLRISVPDDDNLRRFSRSPHPYHRTSARLPDSDSAPTDIGDIYSQTSRRWRTPKTSSDSGTEADDESTGLLKGLPAPPARPRKGLRVALNSGEDPSLWFVPARPWPFYVRSRSRSSRRSSSEEVDAEAADVREKSARRRRIEVLRRLSETALLLSLGAVVLIREDVRLLALSWHREILTHVALVIGLYALYPFRISRSLRLKRPRLSFSIPSSFDPAPLLYPIIIPVLVSLSLSHQHPASVLPNIILSLSSLPPPVIPLYRSFHGYSLGHWLITSIPIIVSEKSFNKAILRPLSLRGLDSEILFLVFPLQQALIPTFDFLLTTSLLPAELQLLATALIDLLIFSTSSQAEILKALLWLGGICVFISCQHVLRWEVALARVPTWKFRRSPSGSQSPKNILNILDHKICQKLSQVGSTEEHTSDSDVPRGSLVKRRKAGHGTFPVRSSSRGHRRTGSRESASAIENIRIEDIFQNHFKLIRKRRHTISSFEGAAFHKARTTPSGRRKRSLAPGLASFLSLTAAQAQVRKWLYALYTYAAVLLIIMGPVRKYVGEKALHGREPFGWAFGYLFGNIPLSRFWVVMSNLEGWITLPPLHDPSTGGACHLGWVEHLRYDTFGEANTRLMICAYCVLVLITGMAIVFRLSSVVEVDTRRKVFHGMMVVMFLPTIYIDPTFSALALALVLAIFLLLDLFRASQLPPISRPLTHFLAPYTDGRDHRGPVIVSHIFLLIGCAVPLWLSLADTQRGGSAPWEGWDVLSRDVSMVSGVICVGMGDAAASLIGRRFGRLKWFWGGGKSLEGSLAFTAAVSIGLIFARAWLLLGGWQQTGTSDIGSSWPVVIGKSILAAAGASMTEAVLTGGNDNVIVPVVLWLLVRGLSI